MREIKFRAYRKFDSKMYNVFSFCKDFIKIDTTAGVIKYLIDDFSPIMQSTGLTDKNGKEIYENDVIHFESHKGYLLNSFIGEVIWLEEQAAWGYRTSGYDYPFNDTDEVKHDLLSHTKVIGNIHENTELLK